MVKRDNGSTEWGPPTPAVTTTTVDPRDDYIIQNWQFEIRKLTFDDAGTYQCLLPLVKPISKNITLQVIPDLTIESKDGTNYKLDDKIVLKCRATMRTLHKTPSLHLIHQRQSKSSILWYKENEIIKSSSPPVTSTDIPNDDHDDDHDGEKKMSGDAEHKIEIETRLDNNEQTLNSILTIYKARESDSGKYRCIYDNIQENVQIKVINDHYEYKKYLSSVNNNSAGKTTYFTTSHTIFFLFISLLF